MKVAIVEWDTKVPVWHCNNTPSYLFDSTKIVDANAFGACASAVNGSLFGYRWFKDSLMNEFVSALNKYDAVYLVTRYRWKEFLELAQQIKTRKVLGFGMGLDQFKDGLQQEGELKAFLDLMHECDRLTSFSSDHTLYLSRMSNRHVYHLPMAYPYRYVMENIRKKHDSKRIMITGPVWNGGNLGRRDDIGSCLIAADILKRHSEPYVEMIDMRMHTPITEPVDSVFRLDGNDMSRVKIIPRMTWPNFMNWASDGGVSIHWDWSWSTGRVAADMAALGVPHLGGNSDHDIHLYRTHQHHDFPMYSDVGIEFDLFAGADSLEWLLFQDNSMIVEDADDYGLNTLDYKPWKENFDRIVEENEMPLLDDMRPDYRTAKMTSDYV